MTGEEELQVRDDHEEKNCFSFKGILRLLKRKTKQNIFSRFNLQKSRCFLRLP